MSRWSRKSPEEKEATLNKLLKEQESKADIIKKHSYVDTDWRLKILKEGEIPLFCDKHGWTKSNKYTLITKNDMFGKSTYVLGQCPECGRKFESLIPMGDPIYIMWISLNVLKLKRENRLEDRR